MKRREMLERLEAGESPLEVSIIKWKDIANGKDMEYYAALNCALCEVSKDDCSDCVVCLHTGNQGCKNTPYMEYAIVTQSGRKRIKTELRRLAKKEVKFLKSLRPKKKKGL